MLSIKLKPVNAGSGVRKAKKAATAAPHTPSAHNAS
jgi:hypothetical protein